MGFAVVSLGDLVADIVLTIPRLPVEPDAHQLARSARLEPGGAGNFLIAGARLGMKMIALGAIGADPFGASAADALAREGVDLRGLVRQPGGTTTTVVVLVDDAGQHVFLGAHGVGPAIALPETWREAILEAHALFASGYILHEQRLSAAALEGMALARSRAVPVFFDPGPYMAGLSPEQRRAVLGLSDVVLLTESEIPLMTGGTAGMDAALGLLEHGPRMVCLKRGSRGCVILTAEALTEHPGFPVTVRDTTAAGDSFDAAFIYAQLHGWPPAEVAVFANAMGAAKVRKAGSGSQVPTADEVRGLLAEFRVNLSF